MELLIGAGNRRHKHPIPGLPSDWSQGGPVTLDIDPAVRPNVLHDLARLPLPFSAGSFDEIHAYEVMEHIGQQGDWRFFFAQWADFWRMLKPGGVFVGTSPARHSQWAWGDPGHTRIVSPENLVFLCQPNYAQVGTTPMTDYRHVYQADFDILKASFEGPDHFVYALRAVKPSRCTVRPAEIIPAKWPRVAAGGAGGTRGGR